MKIFSRFCLESWHLTITNISATFFFLNVELTQNFHRQFCFSWISLTLVFTFWLVNDTKLSWNLIYLDFFSTYVLLTFDSWFEWTWFDSLFNPRDHTHFQFWLAVSSSKNKSCYFWEFQIQAFSEILCRFSKIISNFLINIILQCK